MKYAVKNKKKVVLAYPLGSGHPMEAMLIEERAIRSYALFSQEAVHGQGQLAQAGDYSICIMTDFAERHIAQGENVI